MRLSLEKFKCIPSLALLFEIGFDLVILTKEHVDLIYFKQAIVPRIMLLKTRSSFKWVFEAGNQGIYSVLETIVLYQALDVQHCFSCLLVYQGITRGNMAH